MRPNFFHIAHSRHANNKRTQNHRNNHHFNQIDKHRTYGRYPQFNKLNASFSQKQPDNNRQYQGKKNLQRQVHFRPPKNYNIVFPYYTI